MHDVDELGWILVNGTPFFFNPTVQEMLQLLNAQYNEDAQRIQELLEEQAIFFSSEEDAKSFMTVVFANVDRFNNDPPETATKTLDYYTDSDAIVTDLMVNLPSRFKCIQDVQKLPWWEFLILVPNISGATSKRAELRGTEMSKGKDADTARNARIKKAQQSITINSIHLQKSEVI